MEESSRSRENGMQDLNLNDEDQEESKSEEIEVESETNQNVEEALGDLQNASTLEEDLAI